jgi:UbiD family decarboxylase
MMSDMSSAYDLRAWLEKADELGQLKHVQGADAHLEIGAITELNAKTQDGPALLFDKIGGHPDGFRVLTGVLLNPITVGMTMGIEQRYSKLELCGAVYNVLQDAEIKAGDFPPESVTDGPVMQNKFTGDDIDLSIFPAPLWHDGDGGPYIGTGGVQVDKDPDSDWTNLGTYRVQLLDKNTLGTMIDPIHHGAIIRKKYWDNREPAPVVFCFGQHPLLLMVAGGFPSRMGQSELNLAGAITGRRVPVIAGPVTGLPIPADAEIAVEGFMYPGQERMEGPFGEFTGYFAAERAMRPYLQAEALYYRNDPIIVGAPPSKPPHDYSYMMSLARSAGIKDAFRTAGIPGIKEVWVSEAGALFWIVTSIAQQYEGHALQAAGFAALCSEGIDLTRYSIVVDDDVDPSNSDEVIWALSTRTDPATDVDILRRGLTDRLDPMITPEQVRDTKLYNTRAIINACIPYDRLANNTFSPVAQTAPGTLKAVRQKWAPLFDR